MTVLLTATCIGGAGIVRVVEHVRQVVMILFPWILEAVRVDQAEHCLGEESQRTFYAHTGIMSWNADGVASFAERPLQAWITDSKQSIRNMYEGARGLHT